MIGTTLPPLDDYNALMFDGDGSLGALIDDLFDEMRRFANPRSEPYPTERLAAMIERFPAMQRYLIVNRAAIDNETARLHAIDRRAIAAGVAPDVLTLQQLTPRRDAAWRALSEWESRTTALQIMHDAVVRALQEAAAAIVARHGDLRPMFRDAGLLPPDGLGWVAVVLSLGARVSLSLAAFFVTVTGAIRTAPVIFAGGSFAVGYVLARMADDTTANQAAQAKARMETFLMNDWVDQAITARAQGRPLPPLPVVPPPAPVTPVSPSITSVASQGLSVVQLGIFAALGLAALRAFRGGAR